MSTAFLLRFQEVCAPDETPTVICGTRTLTETRRESSDLDPHSGEGKVFPLSIARTKTETVTKVKGKDVETDHQEKVGSAIPRMESMVYSATKSVTFIKRGDEDADRDRTSLSAIPGDKADRDFR